MGAVLSMLVNAIFAVIGGIISWIVARSTSLKTEMSVIVYSSTIFKDGVFPGVTIKVNGEDSKTLTKSEVVLWNSGFTTIYGSDVVEGNRLRIELPQNSQFYASEIEKTTDSDMKFEIKEDATSLDIAFDYCKQGEGIRIAILHDSEKIEFKGKLKTASNIKKYYRNERTVSPKKRIRLKGRMRKLSLIVCMFLYEATIVCFGGLIMVFLLDKMDVIAMLLGFGVCLCGGALSSVVFRMLQRWIFTEDGPPALW